MKKFLSMLFAVTLIVACGKGKEPSKEAEEDDNAPQTSTVASSTSATAPAATAAAPAMPTIQMSADPYCQSQHPTPAKDEEVVVGPGGELANVFVYVKNAPAGNFPPPSTPVTLDQKGCQYHPHVGGIMVGQPLEIKNSDTTLHNVHAMPNNNTQFNEGQPVPMSTTKKFDKAELVPFRIKCDVHGWMKAWMAVMPHPFFAVSQMNGSFTIPNLPPGTYTIVAWHEKYGPKEQQVTVAAKESKALSFSF